MAKQQLASDIANEMTLHFIHKKTKQIIELRVEKQGESIKVSICKVNNSLTKKEELVNEEVCKQLPATTGNIILDTLAMTKHIKKHGYKVASTITSTKSGIRLS